MTPEQLAALVADREAGTPGPWTDDAAKIEDAEDYSVDREDDNGSGLCWSAVGHYGMTIALVVVPSSFGMDADQAANARRIARVPEMETAIIEQAAEIARLTAERDDALARTEKGWARVKLLDDALYVVMGYATPIFCIDAITCADWFVACADVACGLDDPHGKIEKCLAEARTTHWGKHNDRA
jgi:hypothetical protein